LQPLSLRTNIMQCNGRVKLKTGHEIITIKPDSHITCRSPVTSMPPPCHSPAISFQQLSFTNCYHNRCAVNYTSTHVLAPK
jgi:hypothetical protein